MWGIEMEGICVFMNTSHILCSVPGILPANMAIKY